jgi:hypothetical protein
MPTDLHQAAADALGRDAMTGETLPAPAPTRESTLDAEINLAMATPEYERGDRGAVNRVRALFQQRYSDKDASTDASQDGEEVDVLITDARRAVGVHQPELPSQLADAWNVTLEGDFCGYVLREGISSGTAQKTLDWYAEKAIVGRVTAEAFAREFADELTPRQIETLVAWARAEGLDRGPWR